VIRRLLIGGLAAAVSMSTGVSANAAVVIHSQLVGLEAEAGWTVNTPTVSTFAAVDVLRRSNGRMRLRLIEYADTLDSGRFTVTTADVSEGFSASIDGRRLSAASLQGRAVPVETCTFNAVFRPLGCEDTTLSVAVAWAGTGPVFKQTVIVDHVRRPGFVYNDHISGRSRAATAHATIGGVVLRGRDANFSGLANVRVGEVIVCAGGACALQS
jgi:hypothetical protein